MLDVSGRKRAEQCPQEWIDEFYSLDERGDSEKFVLLTLGKAAVLPVNIQLLAVFHAWKCGKLDLFRLSLQNSVTEICPAVDSFLLCHELRVAGRKEESLAILKDLASHNQAEIIQYRYVADFLEFGALKQVFRLMDDLIPRLPKCRAATIQFNYGIAALNQSLYSVVDDVLARLNSETDPLYQFFFNWLKGQFLFERGEHHQSLPFLKLALDLGEKIPSRSTDLAIVAANLLTSAFWGGDVKICQQAFSFIQKESGLQMSALGLNRHTTLSAMMEIVKGHPAKAFAAIRPLFSSEVEFTHDHLDAGFLFLWLLVLQQKQNVGIEVIEKLEAVTNKLNQSTEFFDFSLFRLAFDFMENDKSHEEFIAAIDRFIVQKSHCAHTFHLKWAHAMIGYFQDQSFESLVTILNHSTDYPLLERLMFIAVARKAQNNVGFWRLCSEHITNETTRALASFHLGRLALDPSRIVKASISLKKSDSFSWIGSFADDQAFINSLRQSKVIINIATQKVASLETGENLEGQPQLSQLFLIFFEQPQGIDKENLTLCLGWREYDPLQHDAIIHNLISRLRGWLAKNVPELEIVRGPKGWSFNSPEIIYRLDRQRVELSATPQIMQETSSSTELFHPRLEWILSKLKAEKSITRIEVLDHFGIKKSAAVNDFNILLSKGLIQRFGSGRGVYYRLQGEST